MHNSTYTQWSVTCLLEKIANNLNDLKINKPTKVKTPIEHNCKPLYAIAAHPVSILNKGITKPRELNYGG